MNILRLVGGGYEAWILPEKGANCIRLWRPDSGVEALRTLPEGPVENPYLYGTPLLFPPNRIAGGRFALGGREYHLPVNEPATGCFLHGTLHQTPFDVADSSTSRARLCYRAEAGAYLGFPHAFTMELSYVLGEAGLVQQVRLTNESKLPMPAAVGFHTTFRLPFVPDSKVDDVRLQLSLGEEYLRNMATFLPTWETAVNTPFHDQAGAGELVPCRETISRHFAQGPEHKMILTDQHTGVRIVYHTPDYGFWMVYNGGAKDFLCVEPQTWVNDAPHAPFDPQKSGFASLDPGKSLVLRTELAILS